jgi:hypothetical protein
VLAYYLDWVRLAMLDLFEILGLLLKVFVYALVTVTSAVVIYALLQWWLDKRHRPRLTS